MTRQDPQFNNTAPPADVERVLSPEAQRALAEAEERRRAAAEAAAARPKEVGGRNGPDPIRYGDWEKGGIASDFERPGVPKSVNAMPRLNLKTRRLPVPV